jgi:hypothetical protein
MMCIGTAASEGGGGEGERGSQLLSRFACLNGEALVVLGSLFATHLQHTHNARVIYRTHSLVIHGVPTV